MSRSAVLHTERALAEVARKADSWRRYPQVLAYLSCELVGDLAVAWDRRRPLRFSVDVDGVPAALPQELAALAFQVLQQGPALHAPIGSRTASPPSDARRASRRLARRRG